jgi:peptidoglycan/LPS O-acetylase OafA/YrhL
MTANRRYFAPIDFKTRFPALDGLRALAIAMVFLEHYGGGSHGGFLLQTINLIRLKGGYGVDLFFVLSGFLITGILFDTRNDSKYFVRFFARRSLRILPVFYLLVVILLLLTPIFQYHWRWQHLSFLVYIGNLFGNMDFSLYGIKSPNHPAANADIGHLWSLCVEEQFYLLWPIAVWFIADRMKLIYTAIGFSVLALLLRVAMCAHYPLPVAEQWIIRTLPFRMDALLIGSVLALVLRGPASDAWQRSSKWVLLVFAALTLTIFHWSPAYDSPWLLTVGLTFIALASAGLIGMTLRTASPAFHFFYWKPLRVLGKYSYGFYVYHLVFRWAWIGLLVWVGEKTHSLAIAGLVALPTNFIVTFLVSKLSFDLFESKFLRYKTHFEYDAEVADHKHAFITK